MQSVSAPLPELHARWLQAVTTPVFGALQRLIDKTANRLRQQGFQGGAIGQHLALR
ncbi:hypothetical protein D3C78_1742260 [compost metagenome]